jgi:hypothetical protein
MASATAGSRHLECELTFDGFVLTAQSADLFAIAWILAAMAAAAALSFSATTPSSIAEHSRQDVRRAIGAMMMFDSNKSSSMSGAVLE